MTMSTSGSTRRSTSCCRLMTAASMPPSRARRPTSTRMSASAAACANTPARWMSLTSSRATWAPAARSTSPSARPSRRTPSSMRTSASSVASARRSAPPPHGHRLRAAAAHRNSCISTPPCWPPATRRRPSTPRLSITASRRTSSAAWTWSGCSRPTAPTAACCDHRTARSRSRRLCAVRRLTR